jgi:ankyrin repeat protein
MTYDISYFIKLCDSYSCDLIQSFLKQKHISKNLILFKNQLSDEYSHKLHRLFCNACVHGNISFIQIIYPFITDIHYNLEQAFRNACEFGHFEIVAFLIQFQPIDINVIDGYCLRVACKNNNTDIVRLLLSSFPTINIHVFNESPLVAACTLGNLELIKLLLPYKPDIHIFNDTPFRLACKMQRIDIISLLAFYEPISLINKNVINQEFIYACTSNRRSVINCLIKFFKLPYIYYNNTYKLLIDYIGFPTSLYIGLL